MVRGLSSVDSGSDEARAAGSSQNAVVGGRIREARTRSGLSLRSLAGRLAVSPATMSQVETGKVGVSAVRLARIAELLGVEVAELVPAPAAARPTDADTDTGARPAPAAADPGGPLVGQRAQAVQRALDGIGTDWRRFPPLLLDPVLRAALAAFADRGYHGCSMRDIAAGADMSVPGLYHHYPSKQEMLATLLDIAGLESYRRAVLARDDGGGAATERLVRVVESLALFNAHRLEFARIGVAERRNLIPENRGRITVLRQRIQEIFDAEIEAGVATGEFATTEPAEAGRAVVTLCTGLSNWFRPDGPVGAEGIARTYAEFALGVVRATGTNPA